MKRVRLCGGDLDGQIVYVKVPGATVTVHHRGVNYRFRFHRLTREGCDYCLEAA